MAEPLDLGLFPLDLVALPGERIPLHIFEPRYRQLFADCTLDDRPFVIVRSGPTGTADTGCACVFDGLVRRFEDGRLHVIARGTEPVRVREETEGRLYFSAIVEPLADEPGEAPADLREEVLRRFRAVAAAEGGEERALDPEIPLSYAVAGVFDLPADVKQSLLETRSEERRLVAVRDVLSAAERGAAHAALAAERATTNGRVTTP
ncbi:MAG: LON peptidase substrate-binding domain-containing protein [Thermoleophilia bacterium]